MKKGLFMLYILQAGCGSLTADLKKGTAMYSDLSKDELDSAYQSGNLKKEPFQLRSLNGCFINSAEFVESDIIAPAINETIQFNNALAAINVKATRDMTPTIIDAISGAFIWGCSYWNVSGELIKPMAASYPN